MASAPSLAGHRSPERKPAIATTRTASDVLEPAAGQPDAPGPNRVAGHVLGGVADVIDASSSDIARRFSSLVAGVLEHRALVILAEDDVSQPMRFHGDPDIGPRLVLADIASQLPAIEVGTTQWMRLAIATTEHSALAARADTGALLLLVDPTSAPVEREVLAVWQIVARRLQQHAREATPSYLLESRVASRVRTEVVNELSDIYSTTLDSLLGVLRSNALDDAVARQRAVGLAATALVHLRTTTDTVRTFTEESVTSAFERLRDDLRPLVRYRDVAVQFVEPPVDGRALPSEVAHGARAVVRGAILAAFDQPATSRVRVQWDCDGENLLINVRDDGPGDLAAQRLALDPLRQRVLALNGRLSVSATEGWGSEMTVVMPLDPPPTHGEYSPLGDLGHREAEVLDLLTSGMRNRDIARTLSISENTVKFHVSKIFRKLGVHSRSEAAALVLTGRSAPKRA